MSAGLKVGDRVMAVSDVDCDAPFIGRVSEILPASPTPVTVLWEEDFFTHEAHDELIKLSADAS